jgi:hypothetical protein
MTNEKELLDVLNRIADKMNTDWTGNMGPMGLFEEGLKRIHDRQDESAKYLASIAKALWVIADKAERM